MISGLEWLLLVAFSMAFVFMSMLVAVWLEGQRLVDVRVLSDMGSQLGMRYRVLGRDHLPRPEPFVLHERPGVVSENSVIERSLVSDRIQGLPAVFEYVSYRKRMGVCRSGPPSLVLAARVPAEVPAFRLRPRFPLERLWGSDQSRLQYDACVPRGWVLHLDASTRPGVGPAALDMESLTGSAVWLQVSGRSLYIALPRSLWPCAQFTPCGIERLVRAALPVLQALDSPDASSLEGLLRRGDRVAQASRA
jgi:hypothetical protein